VLSFSRDAKLLAAGKDFGRVVVWDVPQRTFLYALDTGQGIVGAVAIAPDNQFIATAGSSGDPDIKLWHLPDGQLVRRFKVGHPAVQRLIFSLHSSLVVAVNNAVTYVLDIATGSHTRDLAGEWAPILSIDGKTLMTVNATEMVLRSADDWTEQKRFPKPTTYVYPLSFDTHSDVFLYGDSTGEFSFFAARLSTGELISNPRIAKLPRLNLSTGYFASLSAESNLVFGHSGDRLWLWDFQTGKTCVSEILYSESGALSVDGSLLAGGIDNSFFAKNKIETGVGVWQTNVLRGACNLR
jgi:WD40 repeat protein